MGLEALETVLNSTRFCTTCELWKHPTSFVNYTNTCKKCANTKAQSRRGAAGEPTIALATWLMREQEEIVREIGDLTRHVIDTNVLKGKIEIDEQTHRPKVHVVLGHDIVSNETHVVRVDSEPSEPTDRGTTVETWIVGGGLPAKYNGTTWKGSTG